MAHYICKGSECKTVSEKPTVCLDASCVNRYKLLEECNCPRMHRHKTDEAAIGKNTGGISMLNFGLAIGIVFGIWTFLLGLISGITDTGGGLVDVLSEFYIGYSPTLKGSIAGGLWALFDGTICGVLIAWIYNKLEKLR